MAMMNKRDNGMNMRMVWALVVTMAVLLLSDWVALRFFGVNLAGQPAKPAVVAEAAPAQVADVAAAEGLPAAGQAVANVATPPAVATRVALENARVDARVNTLGGRLDMLTLKSYKGEISDPDGFVFLKPGGAHAEYIAAGWAGAGIEGPGENAVWTLDTANAQAGQVAMVWQNASGQAFRRVMELKPDSYVVTVTEQVHNSAELPVSLTPFVQVHRADGYWPNERSSFVNYFGPMGVTSDADNAFKLHETAFGDLKDDGKSAPIEGVGGWWGITNQYFMAAVMPGTVDGVEVPSQRQFRYSSVGTAASAGGVQDVYTASVSWPNVVVAPNQTRSVSYEMYVGPKHYGQLKEAGHTLEQAISWGWFGPLVKALYYVMAWIHSYTGDWALAVIGLTFLLKLVTFPLANKSYHAMAKMRRLQPKMEELKAKHKDNQQALATEMMAMYKREKVNPMSGCWPMLIQIPIFFAMYKVVLVMFEFRHAPLGLWPFSEWIVDMSVYDPLYVLPVLMGASMWVQFKLNPAPADPTQAMMFKWMPAFMTVMFLWFPAGLVLYWLTNNVLSVAQQYYIMKKDKAI